VGAWQVSGVLCQCRCHLVSLSTDVGCEWAVGCHILRLGRLFIDAPFVSITHHRLPLPLSSPRASHTMSTVPSTSTSHSNFAPIFNAALEKYKRKTKQDLAKHLLLPRLQSCDSPEAILTVLRDQAPEFHQSQNNDDGLTTWVTPTVNVLYSFSAALGGVVGLVNIRIFPHGIVQSNVHLSGIPTSEHNLYGDWCSSPGQCLLPIPRPA
jgi:hypothetical protein